MTAIMKPPEMASVYFEGDFRVVYERRSFLGIINWWAEIKVDRLGKDLVIYTLEKYDSIIVNGKKIS